MKCKIEGCVCRTYCKVQEGDFSHPDKCCDCYDNYFFSETDEIGVRTCCITCSHDKVVNDAT